ncbi:MAG: UPF0280 family protein [Candidatus Aenigmatarchaeota archaeon]
MYRTEFLVKETKVKIIADTQAHAQLAMDDIRKARGIIEGWISGHPEFLTSLEPLDYSEPMPPIIREMFEASAVAGVGPMAAVAGVIAESACRKMRDGGSRACLVENGGDVFAMTDRALRIALYAGDGSPANSLCVELDKENTPLSVCSSSSTMGHSLSFGDCDLVTIAAKSAALADSLATATCNRIKKESDMESALSFAVSKGARTALAVKDDKVTIAGDASILRTHDDAGARRKITRH